VRALSNLAQAQANQRFVRLRKVCRPREPVSRVLCPTSWAATISLGRRLPAVSCGLPASLEASSPRRTHANGGSAHSHTWPCSRWGLPGRSCHHAAGGLLRHLFTLACPAHAERAVCFCGPSPRVAPPGHYPAPRSVELGLSSPCQRCAGRGRPAPLGKSILARTGNDVKRKTSYCYTRHENSPSGTLGDSYWAW